MPIYEYECGACQHRLEAFQKMSDAPLTECPECKKTTLNKLISASGFQLKGTGWYATDFKNKGKPQPTSPSSDTATSTTQASNTSSDNSAGSSNSTTTTSTDKADKT